MMKLEKIFKDEAETEEVDTTAWLRKLLSPNEPQQAMPQFLALRFNHNAGQLYFAPMRPAVDWSTEQNQLYLADKIGSKYLGKAWLEHRDALFNNPKWPTAPKATI